LLLLLHLSALFHLGGTILILLLTLLPILVLRPLLRFSLLPLLLHLLLTLLLDRSSAIILLRSCLPFLTLDLLLLFLLLLAFFSAAALCGGVAGTQHQRKTRKCRDPSAFYVCFFHDFPLIDTAIDQTQFSLTYLTAITVPLVKPQFFLIFEQIGDTK
jgi:hypothetical protein